MAELQKITPNLWCNGNAKEMAEFYTSVFPSSKITGTSYYPSSSDEGLADFQLDMAGKELTVDFELVDGFHFTNINAGPEFTFTPAISIMVNFDPSHDPQAREHVDEVWNKLAEGGKVLMPLDKYPYSEYYGWIKDKFGLTWQLILTNPEGEDRPCMIPSLMFGSDVVNKAEEAMAYYTSLFADSKIGTVARYPTATGPASEGSLMFADFTLAAQWFTIMDSGVEQDFTFNEALSLSVACKDQAEIDELWAKLSANPENEQCGWCKDKYGVSWQIVPENMGELMQQPGAYAKMMQMHKIVIEDFYS